jgi:hypothetical protein
MWPNPVTNVLNFATAPDAIRLLDFSGKTIEEHTRKMSQLSTEHLPSGLYLVQARYGEEWKTVQVIK